jgi:hypothetical protein
MLGSPEPAKPGMQALYATSVAICFLMKVISIILKELEAWLA